MNSSSNNSSSGGRKVSSFLILFAACMIGVGMGLFGMNYWHASKCASDRSPNEVDDMIDALNKRILQAESMVHRNEILMNKVIKAMQSNLYRLEKSEYEQLTTQSKDEAVRIALYLANHPAPPMPDFSFEEEYTDPESLADKIDDIFNKLPEDDKTTLDKGFNGNNDKSEEKESSTFITDAEAEKTCLEWREKYKVIIGVSWGDLPFDLQQKWLEYSCDYQLRENKEEIA